MNYKTRGLHFRLRQTTKVRRGRGFEVERGGGGLILSCQPSFRAKGGGDPSNQSRGPIRAHRRYNTHTHTHISILKATLYRPAYTCRHRSSLEIITASLYRSAQLDRHFCPVVHIQSLIALHNPQLVVPSFEAHVTTRIYTNAENAKISRQEKMASSTSSSDDTGLPGTLTSARYGKDLVRVCRVVRDGDVHHVVGEFPSLGTVV